MSLRYKIFRLCLMALCLSLALPPVASAADWPKSTIKILVPFSAGGANDLIARILAPEMSKILGVALVVENATGAGGAVGVNKLAVAKPDGYTIMYTTDGPTTISPNFIKSITYTTKEFAPIAQVVNLDQCIYVNPNSDVKTVKDLLAKAEKEPVSVGMPSIHGSPRIAVEKLLATSKRPELLSLVPFSGGSEVAAAVMGGKITAGCSPLVDIASSVKNGSLTVIAIAALERDPAFPDIPTLKEQGYPVVHSNRSGFAAPAKTPPAVIAKLDETVAQVVKLPQVVEAIKKLGCPVQYLNAKDFTEAWHKAYATNKELIDTFGLK